MTAPTSLLLSFSSAISSNEEIFSLKNIAFKQGGRSWRASRDCQISLNASAERAFANFCDKKTPYFTIANFCNKNVVLQLQVFAAVR